METVRNFGEISLTQYAHAHVIKNERSTLNKLKNNSLILYGTELISSKHFIFKLKNSSKIILKKKNYK